MYLSVKDSTFDALMHKRTAFLVKYMKKKAQERQQAEEIRKKKEEEFIDYQACCFLPTKGKPSYNTRGWFWSLFGVILWQGA